MFHRGAVSQVCAATFSEILNRLIGKLIQPPSSHIFCELAVPVSRVELRVPRTK